MSITNYSLQWFLDFVQLQLKMFLNRYPNNSSYKCELVLNSTYVSKALTQ